MSVLPCLQACGAAGSVMADRALDIRVPYVDASYVRKIVLAALPGLLLAAAAVLTYAGCLLCRLCMSRVCQFATDNFCFGPFRRCAKCVPPRPTPAESRLFRLACCVHACAPLLIYL
jgi:hypothetical protein